jgi:hypothetical protein
MADWLAAIGTVNDLSEWIFQMLLQGLLELCLIRRVITSGHAKIGRMLKFLLKLLWREVHLCDEYRNRWRLCDALCLPYFLYVFCLRFPLRKVETVTSSTNPRYFTCGPYFQRFCSSSQDDYLGQWFTFLIFHRITRNSGSRCPDRCPNACTSMS